MNKDNTVKIVDAPLPIPFDQLAEIFEMTDNLADGETIRVIANYSDCEYKGKKLLYYIANVDVHVDLSFYNLPNDPDPELNPPTFSDALDLLGHYMKLDRISDVFYLNTLAAYALLVYGGYNLEYFRGLDTQLQFDYDMVKAWTEDEENAEVLHKWFTFFHSLPIFMIESHSEIKSICPPNEVYSEIDDINYISLNVINLVKMPGFVDYFFTFNTRPIKERYIFKEQFNEAIFDGYNLYHYLINAESETFAACISLFEGRTSLEDILMVDKAAKQMDELLAKPQSGTDETE